MTRRVSTYKRNYKVSKKGVRKSKKTKKSKRSTRKGGFMGYDFRAAAAKAAGKDADYFKKDRGIMTGIGQGIRDAQTKIGERLSYASSGRIGADVLTKDRGIGKFAKDSYNSLDGMGIVPHSPGYEYCDANYDAEHGRNVAGCEGHKPRAVWNKYKMGGKRRRSKTSKKTKKTKKSKKSKRSTRKTGGGSEAARDLEAHLGPNATIKSGPITDDHKKSVRLALLAYGNDPSRANLISQYTNLQNAMGSAGDWSAPTVQAVASQINPSARFDNEI